MSSQAGYPNLEAESRPPGQHRFLLPPSSTVLNAYFDIYTAAGDILPYGEFIAVVILKYDAQTPKPFGEGAISLEIDTIYQRFARSSEQKDLEAA